MNYLALVMHGKGETADQVSASSFDTFKDMRNFCKTINDCKFAGDKWVYARFVKPNRKHSIKKPIHFTFDLIAEFNRSSIREICGELKTDVLLKAISTMSASVKEKIFQSFSNLKAVILQDELERMGKIDPAEIEQAQQELAFVITYLLDIEVIHFESDHYTRQTEILGVFMD